MFMIMWWSIWIFCLCDCLFFNRYTLVLDRKNRKNTDYTKKFLEIIILTLVLLIITSNRVGEDIINYKNNYDYNHVLMSGREVLYFELKYRAYLSGLTFYEFRAILTFITGSLVILFLKKMDIDISFFLVFYMPVLLFMDSGQFRNQICLYFLLWSVQFLIVDDRNWRNIFKYVISIVIISQIHTAFIFYLSLLIFKIKDRKTKKTITMLLIFCSMTVGMLTLINDNTIPFINNIYSLILSSNDIRQIRYNTQGHWGFIYPLIVHAIMAFMIAYIYHRSNLKEKKEVSFLELTIFLNKISLIFVPFMMMNINYYRFLRNALVFNIITSIILWKGNKKNRNARTIIIFSLVIVTALWFIFEFFIYDTMPRIVDPVLKEGVLFFER